MPDTAAGAPPEVVAPPAEVPVRAAAAQAPATVRAMQRA